MAKEKRNRKPRAPDPPTQQQIQPISATGQGIIVDAGVLAQLATHVGELAGAVGGMRTEMSDMKDRIGSLETEVHDQAIKNETAHGVLESKFSALGATVAGLVADRQRTPPPSGGASVGRKEEDTITKADKLLKFAKEWGPVAIKGIVAIGGAVAALWGAMYAYAVAAASKGGQP